MSQLNQPVTKSFLLSLEPKGGNELLLVGKGKGISLVAIVSFDFNKFSTFFLKKYV